MPEKYIYKCIIVGDPGVGKTSLINRYVEDKFESEYKATIGTNILKKEVIIEGKNEEEEKIVDLTIWDIAGQEKWKHYRHIYYRGSQGCFVVYDVTRPVTFKNVTEVWVRDLFNYLETREIPLILISNKNDLDVKRVTEDQGMKCSREIQAITFLQTSAKTGKNVIKAFETMARALLVKYE
ncbi:MAG: GTP-binding protein [Candidatus Lokiarchaeota archaeon]|nr:GTP-binding protein [Candidatus Lokiarchaeota archaeon]